MLMSTPHLTTRTMETNPDPVCRYSAYRHRKKRSVMTGKSSPLTLAPSRPSGEADTLPEIVEKIRGESPEKVKTLKKKSNARSYINVYSQRRATADA